MDLLEAEYNSQKYELTDQEELAAFPEALSILKRNHRLYKRKIAEFRGAIVADLKSHTLENYQFDFIVEVRFLQNKEIAEIIKNLNFVEREIFRLEKRSNLTQSFSEEIKLAKEKSIVSTIEKLGIPIKMKTISCPFHQEKTPSCHLYEKSNTYKCFGCGAFGDSINFVMNYLNTDFKTAVNYINS